MIKVKMIKIRIISENGEEATGHKKGDIIDVTKDEAEYLIEGGDAELYKEKSKKKKQEVQNKPKQNISIEQNDFILQGKFGPYVNIDAVVYAIRKKYDFKTIYGKTNEEIYCYHDGIWRPDGREIIETISEELLSHWAKNKPINEIVKKIKRQTSINREEFDKIPEKLIPLQNCIYDFENDEIIKYDPKYYFKSKLTPEYNTKVKCPEFLKFLNETLYPDDINVIQEWFGFCLYRRYFIKKGIIFVGEKDTGKSVLLSTLIRFVGTVNSTGISLQKISNNDKFSIATLYNKHLNAYDDLSAKDINDTGGFKIATGGGYATGEYKFQDNFQFINYAKMTFCCNKIPPIKDTDDYAYYDRWMPIECDNQVPEGKQDKFLIDKLTSSKELSGIFNWALIGLKRLLQQNRFSYNKSADEIKRIIDRSGHQLAGFVQDCLIKSDGTKITKEGMFKVYSDWAEKNQLTRMSKEQIGRQLEKYASFITAKREDERYWEGADINFDKIYEYYKGEYDTKDAFKKILRGVIYYSSIDIVKNKASFSSSEQKELSPKDDTYDTFSQEELKQAEEELDDELIHEPEELD